jgi:hypothetical protein
MKIIQFIVCFLLAMLLCGFGCSSSKPTPDPLAGWQKEYGKVDQSIVNDYQDYLQKLPPEDRKYIGPMEFFKDGMGQHAVEIEEALNGTWWFHVLIYDKENKRIKAIKFSPGKYAS